MLHTPPLFNIIEFSLTELCNRKCKFCPRYNPKIYPNRDEHMEIDLYKKIFKELNELGYKDTISYSGFGEPMLYKHMDEAIEIARKYCPDSEICMNTNGDFLDVEKTRMYIDEGLSVLKISLYDGSEKVAPFKEMIKKAGLNEDQYELRVRFLSEDDNFGLILSNRGGTVDDNLCPALDEPLKNRCYYPFYMIYIDYDGKVLICSHDWFKKLVVGDLNKQTIMEIWNSYKMNEIRSRLEKKDRNFEPCNVCNVNGTMYGQKKYESWQLYNALKKTE